MNRFFSRVLQRIFVYLQFLINMNYALRYWRFTEKLCLMWYFLSKRMSVKEYNLKLQIKIYENMVRVLENSKDFS